jgi:hypothetical protein
MRVPALGLVSLLCLSACVTPDQMRQEQFVQSRNGESIYRFWTFRHRDVEGRSRQLCPHGWREIAPRETGARSTIYAQGVPIGHDEIWITIACPADHP